MSDYVVIIPGMAALLVFYSYYLSKPRLPLIQNKIFLSILATEFLLMISETVVVFLNDYYIRNIDLHFLAVLNIIFFILYVFRSYLFFMFTCIITKTRMPTALSWATRAPLILTGTLVISSFWNSSSTNLSVSWCSRLMKVPLFRRWYFFFFL